MRDFLTSHTFITTVKGTLGMLATGSGLYVSVLPEIEAWLRVISLCVGIAVGTASFISIIRHKKRK
jgi:hypothetical protein